MFDEFYVHDILIERKTTVRDTSVYPAITSVTTENIPLTVKMDTPASREQTLYHERNIELTNVMFYPKGSAQIKKTDIIIFDGQRYEVVGKPEHQGQISGVMRLPLREL